MVSDNCGHGSGGRRVLYQESQRSTFHLERDFSSLCFFFEACSSAPCANGGFCYEIGNSYTCVCQNGYGGIRCQTRTSSQSQSIRKYLDMSFSFFMRHGCGGFRVLCSVQKQSEKVMLVLSSSCLPTPPLDNSDGFLLPTQH